MSEGLNRRSSGDRKFPPSLGKAGVAPEPEPPELDARSPQRFIRALVATALITAGALVSTGALILIATIVPLGIDAARGVDVGPFAKQISWADGRTGVAVAIFAATYLVMAIGKLPGYRLDRAGAALLGAAISLTAACGLSD